MCPFALLRRLLMAPCFADSVQFFDFEEGAIDSSKFGLPFFPFCQTSFFSLGDVRNPPQLRQYLVH